LFMNWGIFGSFFIYAFIKFFIYNSYPHNLENIIAYTIALLSFLIPMAIGAWVMIRECFQWSHYPIRFNRQNRMVYFCRFDGTFASAPWDQLFFFNAGSPESYKLDNEIYINILSEDRQTVLETFALPVNSDSPEAALGHWEFVRRYMEEGPEAFYYDVEKNYQTGELNAAIVSFCNDVDGKKETAAFSHERIRIRFFGNVWSYRLNYPFIKLWIWGRIIAMKTCKVPQWPAEIEAVSIVAADDPYVVTAASNRKFSLTTGQDLN